MALGLGSGSGTGRGGGIDNAGPLTILESTLSENQAIGHCNCTTSIGQGGGIIHSSGEALIVNSTITQNRTDADSQYGGGILANGPMSIRHTTIAGNNWTGLHITNQVHLRNSIVAGGASQDVFGNLASSGYNLIGSTAGGGGGFASTDLLNVDPLLGPLLDNGGPTLTMALLPGSPAIDAGDNTDAPEFDQRGPGFPRIVNGTIDIGAFEVQATTFTDPTPVSRLSDHGRI